MMKLSTYTLFSFLMLLSIGISAQGNFWENATSADFRAPLKDRISNPTAYRVLSFDSQSFLDFAENASYRFESNQVKSLLITIPLPDGRSETFTLMQTELMHPTLAARFPELKSFTGKGLEDQTASIQITYSPYFGFNGMILSGKHTTVYIDPITKDNAHYMSYFRKDVTKTDANFECHTDESVAKKIITDEDSNRSFVFGDCNLRQYRLAQSCTGEYAQYHINQAGGSTGSTAGDKAIVQAAMNVTMIRVNGVYERDFGATMQFVANNDAIIYLDGATDPWAGEYNTQTAVTIDAQIGVNNYDIGHNFNTTGGGNAGCINCVCLSNSQSGTHKGRGYTGRSAPIGDPFDIDYVAHEMGHQFGGYHTQSNSSCRSGNGQSEVEPGSASTIMGYAGICSANVQNNSDDYFNYVNVKDIVTTINSGNGSGCAQIINSGNSSPTADAGNNYSIPISTPFKLEGVGTDPNDTGLTYCWEQNDPENPGSNAAPPSTRTVGPMFRSLLPVDVPYRFMPNLSDIINNANPTWEVLPSVGRSMEFSFLVRDNNSAAGCTEFDLMSVTTVAGVGPFLVTSPNTAVAWDVGATETVTWDVAGTTASPVSCANVDILLSTDGGNTYPITLATNVPNDGSQSISVPNNIGTNNRVMVVCSDNIFFDISNTEFTIQSNFPVVSFSSISSTLQEGTDCFPATTEVVIEVGISKPATGTTTVVLALDTGVSTAANPDDYTMSNTTLSFPSGSTASQFLTVTIQADAAVEPDEIIAIDISSVTGSDAISSSSAQKHTITIVNDDIAPSNTGSTVVYFEEYFEGGMGGFTTTTSGPTAFLVNNATTASSTYWTIEGSNSTQFAYANDDNCNCDMSEVRLISPSIDLSLATNPTMTFDHAFANVSGETCDVLVSTNGGTSWSASIFSLSNSSTGTGGGAYTTPWVNNNTVDLSAYAGNSDVKIAFDYGDAAAWAYGVAIDNVMITGLSTTTIQMAVNGPAGYAEADLGPNATVHFYDSSTGNIMCTIENLSAHDYGCTRVEVDRSGTAYGVQPTWYTPIDGEAETIDKAFLVTPTNNNTSGMYEITLFYTAEEIAGWVGNNLNGDPSAILQMVKSSGSISAADGNNTEVSPANEIAFGANWTYTTTWTTGFSGFTLGEIPQEALPVELISFEATPRKDYIDLYWETASELNNRGFRVLRNTASSDQIEIGFVDGHSTSDLTHSYSLPDHEVKKGITYYYQLEQVDFDGTTSRSPIVSAKIDSDELQVNIVPNPVKDFMHLHIDSPLSGVYSIVHASGKLVEEHNFDAGKQELKLDMQAYPKGVYWVVIKTKMESVVRKVVLGRI